MSQEAQFPDDVVALLSVYVSNDAVYDFALDRKVEMLVGREWASSAIGLTARELNFDMDEPRTMAELEEFRARVVDAMPADKHVEIHVATHDASTGVPLDTIVVRDPRSPPLTPWSLAG